MAEIKTYQEYGEELERRLRLKSFPLAIKLLETTADIPKGAQRPLKDMGFHVSVCQAYQLSRRDGATIAMLIEDNWCFEPVVGYGLAAPPDFFMQGHNRFPNDVETLEAGRHYAEEYPKLPTGKYIGIVSAPLKSASFEPDAVLIYCDSSQLSLLLLAREYKDGYNLKCALSSHAACVYALVPALQKQDFTVSIPCRGDHYRAMAGDEEVIFTATRANLPTLISGLRYVEKSGSRLPRAYSVRPEYPLSESYSKIAKMIGYLK